MTFKLSAQLDGEGNPNEPFERYKEYVKQNQNLFPESVLSLLKDTKWYGGSNTISPLNADLTSIRLSEIGHKNSTIEIILRKGDYLPKRVEIKLTYEGVSNVNIPCSLDISETCLTWRYEQFLVGKERKEKYFVHEIEWLHGLLFKIEAKNIYAEWIYT